MRYMITSESMIMKLTTITASLIKSFGRQGKIMKLRTPGKFGHTFANSRNPDEMAPSLKDFHCLLS